MFRGDEDEPGLELLVESLGLEQREPKAPALGMEAQSILKSIETEMQKLQQFDALARTDRHYFRARFNYYKLSILRLRSEERAHLEPKIGKFFGLIMEKEMASDAVPEVVHTPFLEPVRSRPSFVPPSSGSGVAAEPIVEPRAPILPQPSRQPMNAEGSNVSNRSSVDVLSELQLIKMALQVAPSVEGNRLMSEAVDRVLAKLK